MPYEFYKILHLVSLGFVLISTSAITVLALTGTLSTDKKHKKIFSMVHGIFLLVAFVSGFGLLARIGMPGITGWVAAKIGIWIVIGVLPVFVRKKPEKALMFWLLLGILFGAAAILAITKAI